MLRPSYSELMEVLNNESQLSNTVTSRYIIVIAAAKRARQLIDGKPAYATAKSGKYLSIAINEMNENELIIKEDTTVENEKSISEIFENGNFRE